MNLSSFHLFAGLLLGLSAFAAGEPMAPVKTVPHELDILIKTGHIQGAACSEEGVYLSHAGGIEMIGWDGKLIRRIDAPNHLGGIAYADGKLYGAFVIRGKDRGKLPGMIRVWDKDLKQLAEKRFAESLDGIVVLNGVIYTGIDRWGRAKHPLCCLKRLDLDLNDLGNTDIDLGFEISYGVQSMATDGKDLILGCYGGTAIVSADLKQAKRVKFLCAEGLGLVPKSVSKRETPVFFAVRTPWGNMRAWRKDPTNNPPRIALNFFEYENGAFKDIMPKQKP